MGFLYSFVRDHMIRRAFVFLLAALISIGTVVAGSAEPAAHALLHGIWRHQTLQQFADGKLVRSQDVPDGSTMQFNADGTWALTTARSKSSGTYRWLNDETIETIIVQSDIPAQIGFVGKKQINVDSKSLRVTVVYDEDGMRAFRPRDDGTRPKEMRVLSTFERVR
jgi:hypothetical protein